MSSLWGVHIILIGPKSLLSSSFLPFLLIEEKESKIGDGPAVFVNILTNTLNKKLFLSLGQQFNCSSGYAADMDSDVMLPSPNSRTEEEDSEDFVLQFNDTMEEED